MEAKVELSSTPDMNRQMMAELLLEIIKNSDIDNKQKLKIVGAVKIFASELLLNEMQSRRAFASYLKNLNTEDEKMFKEIEKILRDASKKSFITKIKLMKYLKKNLRGKGSKELRENIEDAFSRNELDNQKEVSDQQMNTI
jgi:hypothetical protein